MRRRRRRTERMGNAAAMVSSTTVEEADLEAAGGVASLEMSPGVRIEGD